MVWKLSNESQRRRKLFIIFDSTTRHIHKRTNTKVLEFVELEKSQLFPGCDKFSVRVPIYLQSNDLLEWDMATAVEWEKKRNVTWNWLRSPRLDSSCECGRFLYQSLWLWLKRNCHKVTLRQCVPVQAIIYPKRGKWNSECQLVLAFFQLQTK